MSKNMFAAKLAAGTRKAKKINTKSTKSTKSATSTHKPEKITTKSAASTLTAEKIISKAIPKSTSLTELAYQKDLLNPVDLELFWKRKYLVRIWPD
jgi:hypothetical protein